MADSDSGGTQSKDGINGSTSQDKQSISPTSVPHNIRPNTLNTSGSDAYWFAHAADPPQDRIPSRQNDTPTIERVDDHGDGEARRLLEDNQANGDSPGNQAAAAVAAATARARANLLSPGQNSEYKEDATPLSQREREERFRVFKERQEEERQRRLHELQQQSVLAQKFREQQEEERKRKIDELRQKDLERRMAVEERKRQIWEAEQERKEAILRRNLDREAKIEARRNAQRNSMSFAFGSSTPRVIDLDLGGFANRPSATNAFGSVTLMPAVNGRKIEDQNDLFKRRAPSTDLLDQKPDEIDAGTSHYVLSRSFNIPLDEGHSRSSTEPSNRLNRRSCPGMSSEATRACLTIPDYNNSSCRHGQSPRMTTSHFDLWSNTSSFGWLSGSGVIIGEDPMSRSMVILPSASRGRRRTDLTPTIPWERESSIRSHSPASSSGLSASKRAVSMSRLDILAQPRRRYVVDHSPSSSNIAASSSQGGTSGSTTPGGPRTTSMSKSMLNLANSQTFRRGVVAGLKRQPKGSGMSVSTLYIAGESPQGDGLVTRAHGPRLPSTSPTRHAGIMAQSFGARSFASEPETSKRMSKSMIHLASKPPPRPTRTFRLKSAKANAQAQRDGHSTSTVLALSPNRNDGTSSVSELRKESPSRPRSSMSGASEMSGTSSMASTVSMRSHSGPRRPRPASMVAAIPDPNLPVPTPPQRQSRIADKKSVPVAVTPPRPPRAKSAGPDALPPPKPPPRRASPSKSASSEQVTQLVEKPIASVLPNTVEATPAIEDTLKPEAEKLDSPIEKPKDIIVKSEKPDKLDEPQKAIIEPSKPSVEPPKPIKQDKVEEPSIEQPIQPIPGTVAKPRITSEEEAKAALAEKRRLAREQAEREAKMERLRQEELKRQEEERIRLEEEEQRRLEEEQIKLSQELRRQEEEKLQRAIKEQEEKEADERKRMEEEAKLKVEREEQEKKAREEAEKQRKEAEEKLKREEEERAERKKRVEQIMMRTRAKAAQAQKDEQNAQQKVEEQKTTLKEELPTKKEDEISTSEQNSVVSELKTTGGMDTAPHVNGRETSESSSTQPADDGEVIINSVIGDIKDSTTGAQLAKPSSLVEQNGLSQELINDVPPEAAVVAKSLAESQNKIEHYNGTVIQTNGFNGDAYTQGKSSDVKGDPIVGNLLDFDSLPQGNVQSSVSGASSPPPPPTQFDEFIDLSQLATTTTTQSHVASNENEVNLFNRETDDLNSNRMVSNNPFIAFEDNVTKKQESSFTDLLS